MLMVMVPAARGQAVRTRPAGADDGPSDGSVALAFCIGHVNTSGKKKAFRWTGRQVKSEKFCSGAPHRRSASG